MLFWNYKTQLERCNDEYRTWNILIIKQSIQPNWLGCTRILKKIASNKKCLELRKYLVSKKQKIIKKRKEKSCLKQKLSMPTKEKRKTLYSMGNSLTLEV